jgi:FAD/FMN-containing dehydrogenase
VNRMLQGLRAELGEHAILPGDARYDERRGVYFTGVDRRPAALVRPRSAEEVASVVRAVRNAGAKLSVKGGGHGFTSACVRDGTVVLDLSGLDRLALDPQAGVGRAGGGLTTGGYTAAAAEHGLATGFGDSPSVGIAGLTLHGGIGFLHRRLGLTIDSLLGAQIVTAEGAIVEATAHDHPDLFWALCGGGGNFGVVTRLDLRLHPVAAVHGGMLMGVAEPAAMSRVLELFQDGADAAGDLSGIVQVMRAPPVPMLPAELHGEIICGVYVVHTGEASAADRALARIRDLVPAAVGALGPMAYRAMFEGEGGPPRPALVRWSSSFTDVPSPSALETAFARIAEPHAGMMRLVQLRPLGGAVASVDSAATAFPHREAPMLLSAGAIFEQPADGDAHGAWVRSVVADVGGSANRGPYLGFLAEQGVEAVRAGFPNSHWRRLRETKRAYDPDNVFDGNHNVPPG